MGVEKQPGPRKVSGELEEKGAGPGKPQGQPGNRPVGTMRGRGVQGSGPGHSVEGWPHGRVMVNTRCTREWSVFGALVKGFMGIHTFHFPEIL